MIRNRWRFSKSTIAVGVFGLAVGLLAGLTVLITGQPGTGRGMGLVDDWTHHHAIFSNPGTAADALAQGRFEHWYRTVNDPRYVMQVTKRNPAQRAMAAAPDFATLAARLGAPIRRPEPIWPFPVRTSKQTLKRDWSMDMGSSAKVGAGMYPAKFSVLSDSVMRRHDPCTLISLSTTRAWRGQGRRPASSPTTIFIQRGVPGSRPLIYWQYNTDGGTIVTSPVLSADGTQVAFVQSVSSVASLVLLKWSQNSSLVQLTASPQVVTAADYRTCTAPCMTSMAFHDENNDTGSSPFYDDTSDAIYVGDNAGYLHKFTNIFVSGTPAEITGGGTSSGWPQQMSVNPLSHPVYDSISGNVFVGPSIRSGTGDGRFHRIPAGGGSRTISSAALFWRATVIPALSMPPRRLRCRDGVSFLMATVAASGAVYQFPRNFASGASGTKTEIGPRRYHCQQHHV